MATTTKKTEFITRREAADRLRVHVRTIDRLIKAGELRTKLFGRSRRIYAVSLEAYIEMAGE